MDKLIKDAQGRVVGLIETIRGNSSRTYAPARVYRVRPGQAAEYVAHLASPRAAAKWGIAPGPCPHSGHLMIVGGEKAARAALGLGA